MPSSLTVVLAVVGSALAIVNTLVVLSDRRRKRGVDDRLQDADGHRADVEGLRTLAGEQRVEIADLRGSLATEKEERRRLERKVVDLETGMRRKDEQLDRLMLTVETQQATIAELKAS